MLNWGIWGRVAFPLPGSKLYHVRGGAQSEPRGWSGLSHLPPDTPLLSTGVMKQVLRSIPNRYRPAGRRRGGVTPPVPPVTRQYDSNGASAETPPQLPLCTPSLYPHPMPLLICHNHHRHPYTIWHHKHAARRVAWLVCHAHYLLLICPDAKEVCEDR